MQVGFRLPYLPPEQKNKKERRECGTKTKEKSPYAKANMLIIEATKRILVAYVQEERKGKFQFVHDEMPEVRNLISDYHFLKDADFQNHYQNQVWLKKVADIIPSLWD